MEPARQLERARDLEATEQDNPSHGRLRRFRELLGETHPHRAGLDYATILRRIGAQQQRTIS